MFEGDTADPKTVKDQIEKLKRRFRLSHVAIVGDRGMITSARIAEELKPAGLDWISCLRAPQISALAQDQGALQMSLGSEQTVAAYKSLALVERAFRTLKGVDMQVRPIYHCLSAGRLVRTT